MVKYDRFNTPRMYISITKTYLFNYPEIYQLIKRMYNKGSTTFQYNDIVLDELFEIKLWGGDREY